MSNETNVRIHTNGKTPGPVMGEPPIWFVNSLDAIVPGFARRLLETEFGSSPGRSGLDLKTRELVLIASCSALGPTGIAGVRKRIAAALEAGVSRMDILEVLIQVGLCAGLPASMGALQTAAEVFAEFDARDPDAK
jgi:4-carboxymuconolactone decarboxylase